MSLDQKQPKGYRKAWNGGKRPEPSAGELAFHAHLGECRQCADHPFELCRDGARLFQRALRTEPLHDV